MAPMMIEILADTGTGESEDDLRRVVEDFVWRLTGKQTIYQMIRLADEVSKRGGMALDPLEYKREYNRRFSAEVERRIAELRAGQASPDSFLVRGSRGLLEALVARGVRCYLASGTDIEFVREEARLLDVERYFAGGIFGALTNYKDFSKEKVIRGILAENELQGAELLIVGDGYVEIQNGRDVDAVAFGVYTKESNRYSMNQDKRERLFRAGAHLLAPDLAESAAVLEYLKIGG
jgi:phosphoglycolate phosphatase-like HAD superfamily hydrolase